MVKQQTVKKYNNSHIPLYLIFVEDMEVVVRTLDGESIDFQEVIKLLEGDYERE